MNISPQISSTNNIIIYIYYKSYNRCPSIEYLHVSHSTLYNTIWVRIYKSTWLENNWKTFAASFFYTIFLSAAGFIYFYYSFVLAVERLLCLQKYSVLRKITLWFVFTSDGEEEKKVFSYTIFSFGRPLWNPILRFTISMVFPRVVRLNWLLNTRRCRSSVSAKG